MKMIHHYFWLAQVVFLLTVDEGIVRIYRNYSAESIDLLTAWSVSSDVSIFKRSAGLVCEWHQPRGFLYTGGLSRSIKIWDAEEEICIQVFV
jgi:regulator-associated protein of mTOR